MATTFVKLTSVPFGLEIPNGLNLPCESREHLQQEEVNQRNKVEKIVLQPGNGWKCPRDGSLCHVKVIQKWGHPLPDVRLDFELNESSKIIVGECDSAVGRVVEKVLLTMKSCELCQVQCTIKKAELLEVGLQEKCEKESSAGNIEYVGKYFEFVFEIELFSFHEVPDIIHLDEKAVLEGSFHHKQQGMELYKKGRVISAFYRFSKSLKMLVYRTTLEFSNIEDKILRQSLLLACYLNIAACQLETGLYEHVINNCNKAVAIDGGCVKAHYRRGLAYLYLQEYDKSTYDFLKILSIEPNNKAAEKQLKTVKDKVKLLDDYYAKQMKKLFT